MTPELYTPEQRLRHYISTSSSCRDLRKRLVAFFNTLQEDTVFFYDRVFDPVHNPNWHGLLRVALKKLDRSKLYSRELDCEFSEKAFKVELYGYRP